MENVGYRTFRQLPDDGRCAFNVRSPFRLFYFVRQY